LEGQGRARRRSLFFHRDRSKNREQISRCIYEEEQGLLGKRGKKGTMGEKEKLTKRKHGSGGGSFLEV